MKILTTIAALLIMAPIQAQLKNRVLAAPDYRGGDAVVVKWLTEKGVYPQGFDVYRRKAGASDWTLTGHAEKQEPDMDRLKTMNKTLVQSYAVFYEKSFDYLQSVPGHRAILYLNLSRSAGLSEMLGMTYTDASAEAGKSYEYRVDGLLAEGEREAIGISGQVSTGSFQLLPPPDSIMIRRLPGSVVMKWKIDYDQSATTVIERSKDGSDFTPMTDLPLYVSASRDSLGNLQMPEIYFEDQDIDSLSTYRYRLAAVDYFGQVGEFSEPVTLKPVDFTPPPAPQSPELTVDDRSMTATFAFQYPNPPADLAGFIVLRRITPDQLPEVLSDTLSPAARGGSFALEQTGDYLISMAAIDDYGNRTESVFVQASVDDLIPPDPVKQVQIREDSGMYRVEWAPGAAEDVAGYFIYRYLGNAPEDTTDYLIINGRPYAGTAYTDSLGSGLKGTLWYAVAAVDSNFNVSRISEPATYRIPDEIAPQQPFLKSPVMMEDGITLHWMPNVDEDLKSWYLVRVSDADSVQWEVSPDQSEYTDASVKPGISYAYYLYGKDQSGNVSDNSEPVTVIARGVDESIFDGILPDNIKIKYLKKDRRIQISWKQAFTADNLGVVVYKGTAKDQLRPVSGQLKTPAFEDQRVKEGQTYFYQLRTYAGNGLKKKSETQSITIKTSKK